MPPECLGLWLGRSTQDANGQPPPKLLKMPKLLHSGAGNLAFVKCNPMHIMSKPDLPGLEPKAALNGQFRPTRVLRIWQERPEYQTLLSALSGKRSDH
jgi:hypothetical protein